MYVPAPRHPSPAVVATPYQSNAWQQGSLKAYAGQSCTRTHFTTPTCCQRMAWALQASSSLCVLANVDGIQACWAGRPQACSKGRGMGACKSCMQPVQPQQAAEQAKSWPLLTCMHPPNAARKALTPPGGPRACNEHKDSRMVNALHQQPRARRPRAPMIQCAGREERSQRRHIDGARCLGLNQTNQS